jgi:hypothetical protein
LPKDVEHWSLTTLRENLVKVGAKVVTHDRYVTFQMAEVAASRDLFRKIVLQIDELRPPALPVAERSGRVTVTEGEVCPDEVEMAKIRLPRLVRQPKGHPIGPRCGLWLPDAARLHIVRTEFGSHLGNVG